VITFGQLPSKMTETYGSISTVFLMRSDYSLLLQLRDNIPTIHRPGYWVIPGGHCEPGEPIEVCARRELFEETFYDCSDLEYLDTQLDDADGYKYWLHMYWALYDEKQTIKCLEGQELKFVQRSEGTKYLKIDLLLEYWDAAIIAMETKMAKK
jgi:8-oxo-dGTP pyrophosphatase MutT (NUDIX family)